MMRWFVSGTACLLCLLVMQPRAYSQDTAQAPSATITLRTGVQLVVEDVVVTDKNGTPVHGLQQSDFTVLESKAPQSIKGFEEHGGTAATRVGRPAAAPALPKGVYSNVPATKDRAVTVLLLDGLNTPSQAQPYLRTQLVKFLATERPGTQTAVFSLNYRLRLMQDFTTDPELLKRVVKLQGVQFSPLLKGNPDDEPGHKESEALTKMILDNPDMAPALERMQTALLDLQARQVSEQAQVRARVTMEALEQLARYLAGVPGRKNLLWFSGSFPVYLQRDIQTTGDIFAGQADLRDELKRTSEILARNQVAVYPIDARGLEVQPSLDASQNMPSHGSQAARLTYGTRSATLTDDQFYSDRNEEHTTMRDLAYGTGGEAFYNTNDLLKATERAAADGENYYTLMYTPPPGKPGQFRTVQVTVNKSGLQLAYRRGYYATDVSETDIERRSALRETAGYDSPDASEIPMRVQPVLADGAPAVNTIGLASAAASEHHAYALNLSIDADALHFTQGDDGKLHATLEFATLIYDAKGKPIDSHQDMAKLALDPDRFRAMQAGGLHFHHTVALPVTGKQAVRVLVHDVTTNRVGSLRLSADQIRQAAPAVSK